MEKRTQEARDARGRNVSGVRINESRTAYGARIGENGATSGIRIDENGKASDMDPRTVMSHDGCNPVSRDQELARAHDGDDMLFPGILPGTAPGSLPGSIPESMPPIPPAFFPGLGLFNDR